MEMTVGDVMESADGTRIEVLSVKRSPFGRMYKVAITPPIGGRFVQTVGCCIEGLASAGMLRPKAQ